MAQTADIRREGDKTMVASDRLPPVQLIVDIDDCGNLNRGTALPPSQEEARAKNWWQFWR
jgi:hypothetical protein